MKPQQWIASLLVFGSGAVSGILPNLLQPYLPANLPNWIVIVIIVLLATVATSVASRYQNRVGVVIKAPITLNTQADEQRFAKRGVIALVSPLRLEQQARLKALLDSSTPSPIWDFVQSTNAAPLLNTIYAHRSNLKRCWLVASQGSLETAHLLHLTIHTILPNVQVDVAQAIDLTNNTEAVQKTFVTVDEIFKRLDNNWKPQDIVCEITGGNNAMTLGATLAALDGTRDIGLYPALYDANNQLIAQNSKPTMYSFSPEIPKT